MVADFFLPTKVYIFRMTFQVIKEVKEKNGEPFFHKCTEIFIPRSVYHQYRSPYMFDEIFESMKKPLNEDLNKEIKRENNDTASKGVYFFRLTYQMCRGERDIDIRKKTRELKSYYHESIEVNIPKDFFYPLGMGISDKVFDELLTDSKAAFVEHIKQNEKT